MHLKLMVANNLKSMLRKNDRKIKDMKKISNRNICIVWIVIEAWVDCCLGLAFTRAILVV